MGKIFVISVMSHRQSKTLINNTALEVDDMDSTFKFDEKRAITPRWVIRFTSKLQGR
jgi:hypothetical protein